MESAWDERPTSVQRDAVDAGPGAIATLIDPESLAETEGFFRTAFEQAGIGMALVAPDGRWRRVNRSLCEIVGYTEAELLQIDFQTITHPEDLHKDLDSLQRLLSGEFDCYQTDKRYIHKLGHAVWIMLTTSLVRDASGEPMTFITQIQDISKLKRAQAELEHSEEISRTTLDSLTANIAILDDRGEILAVNEAWRKFASGNALHTPNYCVGGNYLAVCDAATGPCAEDARAMREGILEVLSGRAESFAHEYPCHSPTEQRWFIGRASRFRGQGPVRIVVAHENVTERRALEERLRNDALHDRLTGLANREMFLQRLHDVMTRCRAQKVHDYAVLFIDLDRFKIINDSLGHAAGDRLLLSVAQSLLDAVAQEPCEQSNALVARLGGDEFVVLLDGVVGEPEAGEVARRILAELNRPVEHEGHRLHREASIGIVMGDARYSQADELLRDADTAMYRAKEAGRNRHATFDAGMHSAAMQEMKLQAQLREALERQELEVHYQPVISLETSRVSGFEALLRWRRNGKLLSPASFIDVAEESGLIVPIGKWVLRQACEQIRHWQDAGVVPGGLSFHVNLSRRQLIAPELLDDLREILQQTQIKPSLLHLEITESMVMQDMRSGTRLLQQIADLGVKLQMDDFGTGYSSLSCLHRFPIHGLKIDRAFILTAAERRSYAAVIEAIITLARNLNIEVVAEGIETAEDLVLLQALDCDFGQGYFFAKPMPTDAIETWLAEQQGAGKSPSEFARR